MFVFTNFFISLLNFSPPKSAFDDVKIKLKFLSFLSEAKVDSIKILLVLNPYVSGCNETKIIFFLYLMNIFFEDLSLI